MDVPTASTLFEPAAQPIAAGVFDRLVRLAQRLCGVQAAVLGAVEEASPQVLAAVGMPPAAFPAVSDAQDEAWLSEPIETRMGPLRWCAHFSLEDATGQPFARLFLFDALPKPPDAALRETLQDLAALASDALGRFSAESLLESDPDALFMLNRDGKIVYWNHVAEALYGWSSSIAVGQHAESLLYEAENEQFGAAFQAALAGAPWAGEHRQVSSMGQTLFVETKWSLVDDAGRDGEVLVANTDVTEEKALQEQLLRSQRMDSLGALAGGIAHDMNNMLGPILMSVQVLRKKVDDERSQQMLNMMEATAKRGAEMLEKVLSFARGKEGERVVVQVADVVREIEHLVGDTFPRSINRTFSTDAALLPVMADATQLHQVLMNLCVNARDAMPDGGHLRVRAVNLVVEPGRAGFPASLTPGNYVGVAVSDTGTGMSADMLQKIFDPFYSTKETGTGLGLSTSMGIIKGHDGWIDVESIPGRGTRFKVYLPATEVRTPEPERPANVEEQNLDGAGALILVVDDTEAVRTMAAYVLESNGYKTMLAPNGAEGWSLFQRHRANIALVLTDMMMPIMDGPGLIGKINDAAPEVPVVAMSGGMTRDQMYDKLAGKATAYLNKPFEAESLLYTLTCILNS